MDDRTHIAWLYGQLPELVDDGTLTPDAAARLRQRFGEVEPGGRRAIVIFGLLGATLIGGGIILLLAHNWDQLSRATRAFLSLLPLLAGQALCFWTLLRRADSAAWREGAGAFLTMAIGSSIALVSQTYHTGGAFEDFMLIWVLLDLPVAYLMRATLPAALYLIGIAVWASAQTLLSSTGRSLGDPIFSYWLLLALALPWWWSLLRDNRYQSRAVAFGWALAMTVPVGYAVSAREVFDAAKGLWPLWASLPAVVLFLAGSRWWPDATTIGQRPFQIVGGLGAVALGLALSFEDVWRGFSLTSEELTAALHAPGLTIALAWLLAALGLWVASLVRREPVQALIGAMSIMAAIGCFLASRSPATAMAMFNLYLLAVGVGVLAAGLRVRKLGVVNAGLLIIAALILCRFFDADIGFVARGLAFIAVGAGFLVANLVLLRRAGARR